MVLVDMATTTSQSTHAHGTDSGIPSANLNSTTHVVNKPIRKNINLTEDVTKAVDKDSVTEALLKEGSMFVADCHCQECSGKIVFIQTDGKLSL